MEFKKNKFLDYKSSNFLFYSRTNRKLLRLCLIDSFIHSFLAIKKKNKTAVKGLVFRPLFLLEVKISYLR